MIVRAVPLFLLSVLAACAASPPQTVEVQYHNPVIAAPKPKTGAEQRMDDDLQKRLKHIQSELDKARALLSPEPTPDYP
jgi:hypothetical protein